MTDVVWEGASALRSLLVPVSHLERHPRNPRRGQVAEIAASLRRFGQVRPILHDGRRIIAGNHTYLAALEVGWTHIAAVANDFRDEAEATAYLLADNRLPELGHHDNDQLLALLAELEQAGAWEGTGYSSDDLEDLRALHGRIPETDAGVFEGGYAATEAELAERAAQLAGGRTIREVSLLLTVAQQQQFDEAVTVLRKAYGTGGVSETVYRALEENARRLNLSA